MANRNDQLQQSLNAALQRIATLQSQLSAATAALANADAQVTSLTSQLADAQANAISDANLALASQLANGEIPIPS